MAETTGIAWTDSTFNPWIGCTRVGPGCDFCYAEALDRRHRWGGVTHWGVNVPRTRTSAAYWRQPLRWNAKLSEAHGRHVGGVGPEPEPHRVFCASLADVFDNEVPQAWRDDLWTLIRATPYLTWQVVTKRIGNAEQMLPSNWGAGYPNVWLLSTICNQEEADRDLPKLLQVPAALHGVSYEPALGPVDWRYFLPRGIEWDEPAYIAGMLRWIIVGGESGPRARPFDIAWARSTVAQCRIGRAACFVKQLGAHAVVRGTEGAHDVHVYGAGLRDRKGGDMEEWPEDIRIREFPA